MPRILALDYGRKRVGLALSDPTGTLATGLPTLERKSLASLGSLAAAVADLVRRHEAAEVVLGHPLNMDGSAGPRAREVELFAGELRRRLRVPVMLCDERLSTEAAYGVLRESGVSAKRGKKRVDRLSAVILLQEYLDRS